MEKKLEKILCKCTDCGHGFSEDDFYEDYCKSDDFAAKITCPSCKSKLEIYSTIIGTWVVVKISSQP